MRAKDGVVERLNAVLTIDLTAINQYFAQSEIVRNWGFPRVAEKFYEMSLGEMKDAQKIIRHILFLDGLPNVQRMGQVRIGESVEEDLRLDLDAEIGALEALSEAAAHCETVGDFGTRELLEGMIREEEEHIDWIETQLETIRQVGVEHYLAQSMRD